MNSHFSDSSLNFKKYGRLAYVFCGKRLPLDVLHSNRGFYIGTYDDVDGPCSRESIEYFDEETEAKLALVTGNWTQKEAP